jgi:hypothetical protein
MDTFWLKIAAVIVVIAGVFIGYTLLKPAEQEKPKEQPKTIYDMEKQDRKDLLAEPNASDFEKSESAQNAPQTEAEPEKPASPVTLYFKEVSEIDKIQADNILATIPSFRTIGRLPFTGYGVMVQSCRQLMQKFPGTIYDYKARRALAQVPQRYWDRYKITDEEVDLDYFKQQRPNTIPYTVTEDD